MPDDSVFHISDPNADAGVRIAEGSHRDAILAQPEESIRASITTSEDLQKSLLRQNDYRADGQPQTAPFGAEHNTRPRYTVQNFSEQAAAVGLAYNNSARYANFNRVEEIEKAIGEKQLADSYQYANPNSPSASPDVGSGADGTAIPFPTSAAPGWEQKQDTEPGEASTARGPGPESSATTYQQNSYERFKASILDEVQYGFCVGAQKIAYGVGSAAVAVGHGAERIWMQSAAQSDDVGERGAVKTGHIGFETGKYVAQGAVAGVKSTAATISAVRHGIHLGTAQEAVLGSLAVNGKSIARGFGRAALDTAKREAQDFYGSDDLGMEAIRKPKNIVFGSVKTFKTAKRAGMNVWKVARATGSVAVRTARWGVAAIRTVLSAVSSKYVLAALAAIVGSLILILVISSIVTAVSSSVIASPNTTATGKIDLSPYVAIVQDCQDDFDAEINRMVTSPMYDNVYIEYYGATDNTREILSMMAVYCEQDLDPSNSAVKDYLMHVFDYSNYYTTRTQHYTCSGDYRDDSGSWVCTGHTDLYISVYVLSFDDLLSAPYAKNLYDDPDASDFWTDDKIEWCQNIYAMDWDDLYDGIDGLSYSSSFETDLSGVIGDRTGADAVVALARHEYDVYHNSTGGDKYWRWYGFDGWVNWCATFVSWVGAHASDDGSPFPKFASCSAGIQWFASHGQWAQAGDYTPQPGDLIFFDWKGDGAPDHVGIVDYVSDGRVYTIEGNTNSSTHPQGQLDKHSYELNSAKIFGYAVPNYN